MEKIGALAPTPHDRGATILRPPDRRFGNGRVCDATMGARRWRPNPPWGDTALDGGRLFGPSRCGLGRFSGPPAPVAWESSILGRRGPSTTGTTPRRTWRVPLSRGVCIPCGNPSFEFGENRSRGYKLLEAARTAESLSAQLGTAPANEAQARELSRVPEERRGERWTQAAIAATLGVAQQTVNDWFSTEGSNGLSANASLHDARVTVSKTGRAEVWEA